MSKIRPYIVLHFALLLLSFTGVLSKLAAENSFFSPRWIIFYVAMIFVLGIYALIWQQVIKRIPLSTAFMNKAVTIIWALVWGFIIFGEDIDFLKIIGAVVVIIGVLLFVRADESSLVEKKKNDDLFGEL